MKITLVRCARAEWDQFKTFHYAYGTPLEKLVPSSRCYLAYMGDKRILVGFCASISFPTGTIKNAWRAHKTVVRMPKSPAMFKIWAAVSDEQARLHVIEGKKFYSAAPAEYADYRDSSPVWKITASDRVWQQRDFRNHEYRWFPTCKDTLRQRLRGERSHEFREVTAEDIADSVAKPPALPNDPYRYPKILEDAGYQGLDWDDDRLDSLPDDGRMMECIMDIDEAIAAMWESRKTSAPRSLITGVPYRALHGLTRDRSHQSDLRATRERGEKFFGGKLIVGTSELFVQRWLRKMVIAVAKRDLPKFITAYDRFQILPGNPDCLPLPILAA